MNSTLTLKQRKFWKGYTETHSLAEAARYAGSKGKDNNSLHVIGSRMLQAISPSIPELLNAAGATDEILAKKTLEGLEAKKTMLASFEGKFTDERVLDDHPTRAKYIELLGRMKGAFVDKHELTGRDGGDLILEVHPRMAGTIKGKGNTTLELE